MNPIPEVGSPGYTDNIDARLDRVAHLLAVQQTKARSKRMLLSLFQNFAKVARERRVYVEQVPSRTKTRTVAWADGYLAATAHAINFYLEKRWSVSPLTFEECELLIERPTLAKLFEHGTDAGTDKDHEITRQGGDLASYHKADPGYAQDTDA